MGEICERHNVELETFDCDCCIDGFSYGEPGEKCAACGGTGLQMDCWVCIQEDALEDDRKQQSHGQRLSSLERDVKSLRAALRELKPDHKLLEGE